LVITLEDNGSLNNPALRASASDNNVANDSVHGPSRALEESDTCWYSNPGMERGTYKLYFPWYTTLKEINISYCMKPGKHNIHLNKRWNTSVMIHKTDGGEMLWHREF
jgi:hypothetical protein